MRQAGAPLKLEQPFGVAVQQFLLVLGAQGQGSVHFVAGGLSTNG
jgi:hypothetical protein